MTTNLTIHNFDEYMTQYFKVKIYDDLPKIVAEDFEEQSGKFNHPEDYIKEFALNIVQVDINNFVHQSASQYRFLDTEDVYEVYVIELPKPYLNKYRNNSYDYTHMELLYLVYIYNKTKDIIVGFTEVRLHSGTYQSYFQSAFVGMIKTKNEFRQQQIAKFMLRLSASYVWFKTRKKMHSGTSLSPDMLNCYDNLSPKSDWIERDDYYQLGNSKKRFLIHPVRFGVTVEDGYDMLEF